MRSKVALSVFIISCLASRFGTLPIRSPASGLPVETSPTAAAPAPPGHAGAGGPEIAMRRTLPIFSSLPTHAGALYHDREAGLCLLLPSSLYARMNYLCLDILTLAAAPLLVVQTDAST